mgnify:CR=1 FL=1
MARPQVFAGQPSVLWWLCAQRTPQTGLHPTDGRSLRSHSQAVLLLLLLPQLPQSLNQGWQPQLLQPQPQQQQLGRRRQTLLWLPLPLHQYPLHSGGCCCLCRRAAWRPHYCRWGGLHQL